MLYLLIMTTSAIQALATGLPCVTTDHSGFPEQIIHDKNGYLAKEADPQDIADKILEYLANPERWPEMSKVARQTMMERYDCRALIQKQVDYYQTYSKKKSVAFVVGVFPAISETFIINQVADLIDRGFDVQIYTFTKGKTDHVSDRYASYDMERRTQVIGMPMNPVTRFFTAVPKFLRVLFTRPVALAGIFNISKYGRDAASGKLLFWSEPFLGISADIVHCHFGKVANRYLVIREMLKLKQDVLTTFYGFDISQLPKQHGPSYYDRLKESSKLFFVMSENMKHRVAALGFDPAKIVTLPISIDVKAMPFAERSLKEGETVRMISVGRFVEKKGFDDMLKAVAILKNNSQRPFKLSIIGGGELENDLKKLARELDIEDKVEFLGFRKIEDVIRLYMISHLYLQTSKTAANGDME